MTSSLENSVTVEKLPDGVLVFTLQGNTIETIRSLFTQFEKHIDYSNSHRTTPDLIVVDTKGVNIPLILVYDELIKFYEKNQPPPSRTAMLVTNSSIITSALNLIAIAVSRYQRTTQLAIFRLYEKEKALAWVRNG
jgi:hypothetical protein